ncbi:hypothetical protein D9M69_465310 [compost metagenome]
MQALAFADHSQVIGLQAHRQTAETEQPEQQHGGGGQWFPVRTQTGEDSDFRRTGGQALRALRYLRAVPDRLGLGERLGIQRIGVEPCMELAALLLVGTAEHNQPVQGLVHRACGVLRR